MFMYLDKIIDSLSFKLSFLNRSNSPSTKQTSRLGDNIGRDKNIYINNPPQKSFVEVRYAWTVQGEPQENDKIIAYEFDLSLLNKSEEIIKDLWVNFDSSGFNLEVEQTKHTNYFEGEQGDRESNYKA